MSFERSVVLLGAALFALFGISALLWPEETASLARISASHPSARNEVRAFFGGIELGFAAFLVLEARRHLDVPLRLLLLTVGGSLTGRFLSIVQDGVEGGYVPAAITIDAAMFVLAFVAFRRIRERR